MQFRKIALAAAALAAGAAFAAPAADQIAISSGASASKGNLKTALTSRCSGQLAEFVSGGNISTYVCAAAGSFANASAPTAAEYNAAVPVAFTNTVSNPLRPNGIAELRLNVNGGSFTAVCLLAGWPSGTKCPAPDTYLNPATGTLVAANGTDLVVGGLMDVEPNAFLASVRTGIAAPGSVVSAQFGQAFGVAVSADLYNAMFADQQASLGQNCAVSDTARPECVPVIGKAQMAAIMSSNSSNDAYVRGANFLAPSQITSGTTLKYLRRVDTSGTQAAGQQYFLGNVCSPAAQTVVPEGAATGTPVGAITVYGLPTTGGVRTELRAAGYAIGIISGENNQAESWRWLRVGGMNLAENAAPGTAGQTNVVTTLNGKYDYWYLSRIAQPAATGPAATFWTSVRAGFATVLPGATPGLFQTSETKFTKGASNSCSPVFSN